jgi:methyl-accepting chemotaxis protein
LAIGQVESVATAIASAVEQQAAATQEISSSVQTVTGATIASSQAMGQVLIVAEQADTASQSVVGAAEEVGQTATTLRMEVDDFLAAMKRGNDDDRRAYERVPGGGTAATLTLRGQAKVQALVQDISRGGIALVCNTPATSGTEANIDLSTGASVAGRVVRSSNGIVSIAFRQDEASMRIVDQALDAIRRGARSVAA